MGEVREASRGVEEGESGVRVWLGFEELEEGFGG